MEVAEEAVLEISGSKSMKKKNNGKFSEGDDVDVVDKVEHKKRKRERKKENDVLSTNREEIINEHLVGGSATIERQDFIDPTKSRKNRSLKKRRKDGTDNDDRRDKKNEEGKELESYDGDGDGDVTNNVTQKTRKKKNKKDKDVFSVGSQEMVNDELVDEIDTPEGHNLPITNADSAEAENNKSGKRKKDEKKSGKRKKDEKKSGKRKKDDSEGDQIIAEKVKRNGSKGGKKKGNDILRSGLLEIATEELDKGSTTLTGKAHDKEAQKSTISKTKKAYSIETGSENPKSNTKSKKVKFSSQVEIFPVSKSPSIGKDECETSKLVQGKWFTKEEDEIIKEAVFNYIQDHALGEEGLKMVLNCKSHRKVRNCWKQIGAAIPYRPRAAVYFRAHTLFERDASRTWTKDEYDFIRKHHEEHGNKWKELADKLGKNRIHVKDAWRRIKFSQMKRGHWSQEEYQTLFNLVNMDLRMKVHENVEKKSKHGMLRDNVCWTAISDKLSTRTNSTCCRKWYQQLTSPMVAEGLWSDTDDYRLLDALFSLDACCIEDVDWDNLIENRSEAVCRKRWDQMVLHIGQHGNKSFSEQIEALAKRYCPDLIDTRETWDNKPVVP